MTIRAITVTCFVLAAQVACQVEDRNIDRVNLLFSDEERRNYEDHLHEKRRTDFSLSVRMGVGEGLVPAKAHVRGSSTFSCERKNYTLNLNGKRLPGALKDSATDEFYLLSLCLDDRYVRQHTVLQLWKQIGLFPFEFRYVELTIDGESRGVYLLVEKLDRIRIARDRLVGVMRRRGGGGGDVDVKYPRAAAQERLADYQEFLLRQEELSGPDLIAAFQEQMDLEQYFRWVATNTLLRNGDSIDELWLLTTLKKDPQGVKRDYYRFSGWDPDDIFTPCHLGGVGAFVDPHRLVYCAEAEWDHHLFSDPYCYNRYVDILEDLIERRLTEEVFHATCERTEVELTHFFSRPRIAAAMVELLAANPEATDPAVAIAESRRALKKLTSYFSKARATLLKRIAEYRKRSASAEESRQ